MSKILRKTGKIIGAGTFTWMWAPGAVTSLSLIHIFTGDMSLGAIAASLQSAIKDKGNSEAKVEYKDGRFNITGLTNDVIIKGVDGNAVSYTHLDVYKRQMLYWMICRGTAMCR